MRTSRGSLVALNALAFALASACGASTDPGGNRDGAVDAARDGASDSGAAVDASDALDGTDTLEVDAAPDVVTGPCGALGAAPTDPLVAQTLYGQVRGVRDGNTVSFRGIPYAAPPTGALRFRPPAAPVCWDGVRDATQYGSVCPQALPSGSRAGEEDCLFLNVWTPSAGVSAAPRPVLFFIHGGAYIFGSGNQDLLLQGTGNLYNGQTLADEQNAVVVTINYRLAGLGFYAHPALSAEDPHGSSGNYGTLDQIAALGWVRDNIGYFGGDPARVTVFGESAGGLSVCLLLATPLSRGLFSDALIESGGCNVASQQSRFDQGRTVAQSLGCETASDVAACLRARPAYDFVAQLPRDSVQLFFNGDARHLWELPNGPNVDGYVFPEKPLATLRAGRHAKVPLTVGSNAQEFELFTPPMTTCLDYYGFVGLLFPSFSSDVLLHYPCLSYPTPRDAAVAMGTDFMFTCPARRILRSAQAGGTAAEYRYFFTQTYSNSALTPLRSFHASELAYVFRTFDALAYNPTDSDLAVSRAMDGYWGRFAATGNPNGAGAFTWPGYDVATDNAIRFDDTLTTTSGLSSDLCDFWDGVSLDQ